MRLLGLILTSFDEVFPFKSEIYHQADPCFYVIAAGFRRGGYDESLLETRLRDAIQSIIACESHEDLPQCIETLAEFSTPENHQRIDELLDKVGRVRAIGLSSRNTVQTRESPEAQLVISPVPYQLTMQVLRERMECFGKIAYIKRRSHAIGVGADALIQFAQPAHAACALEAVNDMKVLGPQVIARLAKTVARGLALATTKMPPKKGEISLSVEESNEQRKKLGIKPLVEGNSKSKTGTSNDPVHMPADKKADASEKEKDKDSKKKRDHEELTHGAGLGDILEQEEGKGTASDWIARTRASDGSMQGAGAKLQKDDGKKRKDAPGGESSVPKMKVRHDSEAIKEGESVIMTLSDQRLIDKDGNLVETQDELSNTNLLDSDKAKKNDAIRSQLEYDPHKPNADILDK
eukprot:symbB.v1.2.026264.t2/scaffold2611.1/size89775/8